MIGKNTYLPERDPATVTPIRWKILLLLPEDKWDSPIIRPDTLKKGDTTKQAFTATIFKAGDLVITYNEAFVEGATVVIDPSIDIMNPSRAFRWKEGKKERHYVLCDCSDIIAVQEPAHAS